MEVPTSQSYLSHMNILPSCHFEIKTLYSESIIHCFKYTIARIIMNTSYMCEFHGECPFSCLKPLPWPFLNVLRTFWEFLEERKIGSLSYLVARIPGCSDILLPLKDISWLLWLLCAGRVPFWISMNS